MVAEKKEPKRIDKRNTTSFKELLKLQQSQSEFILSLERRILALEIDAKLTYKHKSEYNKFSSVKTKKEIFNNLVNVACGIWEIQPNQLFIRTREPVIINCRYCIIDILYKKNAYTPIEISELFLKEKNYKIHRTMIYHASTNLEEYFQTPQSFISQRIITNYNQIVEKYMLI